MPEKPNTGPNEAAWSDFSAKYLATALAWPADKLLRFTQHPKFQNLTPQDQQIIWKRLEVGVVQRPVSVPHSSLPAPAVQVLAAYKPSRIPLEIGSAVKSAIAPRRALVSGELRFAMARAAIYWISTFGIGFVFLKIFSGG